MYTIFEKRDICQNAIDYFVYRIGQTLGSLTTALGGLDALVFTAGIRHFRILLWHPYYCRKCKQPLVEDSL